MAEPDTDGADTPDTGPNGRSMAEAMKAASAKHDDAEVTIEAVPDDYLFGPIHAIDPNAVEFHELADCGPMMGPDEFKAFMADIEARGQDDPVDLFDGRILDGRKRTNAIRELADRPLLAREYLGDYDGAVLRSAANAKRKHWDKLERAFAAAKLANLRRGISKANASNKSATLRVYSQSDSAQVFNVPKRTVEQVCAVLEKCPEDVQNAVLPERIISLSDAYLATVGDTTATPSDQSRALAIVTAKDGVHADVRTLKKALDVLLDRGGKSSADDDAGDKPNETPPPRVPMTAGDIGLGVLRFLAPSPTQTSQGAPAQYAAGGKLDETDHAETNGGSETTTTGVVDDPHQSELLGEQPTETAKQEREPDAVERARRVLDGWYDEAQELRDEANGVRSQGDEGGAELLEKLAHHLCKAKEAGRCVTDREEQRRANAAKGATERYADPNLVKHHDNNKEAA